VFGLADRVQSGPIHLDPRVSAPVASTVAATAEDKSRLVPASLEHGGQRNRLGEAVCVRSVAGALNGAQGQLGVEVGLSLPPGRACAAGEHPQGGRCLDQLEGDAGRADQQERLHGEPGGAPRRTTSLRHARRVA